LIGLQGLGFEIDQQVGGLFARGKRRVHLRFDKIE